MSNEARDVRFTKSHQRSKRQESSCKAKNYHRRSKISEKGKKIQILIFMTVVTNYLSNV